MYYLLHNDVKNIYRKHYKHINIFEISYSYKNEIIQKSVYLILKKNYSLHSLRFLF